MSTSTFDIVPDAPGLLRIESVNISLKFDRTGPTTGRISWTIPTPAAGCTADTQAYCGMLVTLDTTPASMDKIPTNGQIYSADASADPNLFAGDKISSSFVIGAFYQNRTTTFFDVTGLMPNTPYYISGYPVDCQFRYFAQGVHAYSLDYTNRGTDGTTGTQVVVLNSTGIMGQKPTDFTGLAPGVLYDFQIQLGVTPSPNRPIDSTECLIKAPVYTITINGTDAQTYQDLLTAINKQFSLILNCVQGPLPPNAGMYYWDAVHQKLFLWDGFQYIEIPVIVSTTAPNFVVVDTYWLNPTTNVLSVWNGFAWAPVTVISFSTDPTQPIADKSYWFDGTNAYIWNGVTWCNVTTFLQGTDPSLPISPPEGSYWYDSVNDILYKWDNAVGIWVVTIAIKYLYNPNALPNGTYWFNQSNNKLYAFNIPSLGWNEQINVAISETAPSTPAPGKFWYNPTTQELFQRDFTNTTWVQLDVVVFPSDPTIRGICDLWWNTTTDQLNVWDSINNVWVLVTNFFQQPIDPTLPPPITNGMVWYNIVTGVFYTWINSCFVITEYILWPVDPTTGITAGTVWFNTTNHLWYVWNGVVWVQIIPIVTTQDPTALATGTFWFDPNTMALQMWNGISWVNVTYTTTPVIPVTGTCWFDTSTNTLKEWNGVAWVSATPPATVQLDCNGNLLFTDTTIGSLSFVGLTDGTLFKSLKVPFAIHDSNPGVDGASDIPSYDELGIGTDGSGAFRNQIANEIRMEFGYPVMDVELTKDQIDYAIDRAIQELRQRAGIGYKRGFFFMRLQGEQQKYFLTNKISGMNKIVDILGIYRLTSSFLSSAHGAGVYGQIVLQHLYNMGTFDLLSYHIMGEYTKLMEMLFAARLTFTWNEQNRELFIHHRFPFVERMVAIEASVERTEQDILSDRYARPWVRRYAAAVCRLILAEIRGKFSTLPGAGGSVTLNAETLRQASATEIEALLTEIENYIVDRPEEWGIGQTFTFG